MPRFDGELVQKKPRFSGERVDAPAAPQPDIADRLVGPLADPLSAAFTSGVDAIPFVGHHIMGALNQFKAAVHNTPVFRSMGYGETTPEELAAENAQIEAEQPVASFVGDVAGPTLALAPLGMTALGAKALGFSGPLGSRVLAGFGSGTGIAFGDKYARTGDLGEAVEAGKWGGVIGGSLPIAGAGLKAGWRALTGNAYDSAERALARAVQDDRVPVDQLQAQIDALGPDATLADLGPNLQRQAGALASLPGEAQAIVRDAMLERAARTNSRITGDVDTILGPAAVPSELDAGLKAAQDALGPDYRAVFDKARAVDTGDLATTLESEIVNLRGDAQKALKQVRGMLDIEGAAGTLDPNPYTLFQTRQAIDGMLETEVNSKVIAALTRTRKEVDSILTGAVPGIKKVDAKFAELARQREALTQGQQLLDSGRTAMRPEELDTMWGTVSGDVRMRLSQGARAEIDRIIGTTANNLTALKSALKGDGSWNRDRLRTLFGRQKADELLDVLEREKTFDATNRVVTQNSETAARGKAQAEFEPTTPKELLNTGLTGLAAAGLQKLANVGARTRRSGTNTIVARALMSRQMDPRTLNAVARAIAERETRAIFAPAVGALIGTRDRGPVEITVRGTDPLRN